MEGGKWNGQEGRDLLLPGGMFFKVFFFTAQPSIKTKNPLSIHLYTFVYKLHTCAGIIG